MGVYLAFSRQSESLDCLQSTKVSATVETWYSVDYTTL